MLPEEKLVSVALALEDALMREAWDEADDLFSARAALYEAIPAYAIPHEIDEIDERILDRLERGQAEIRRESFSLGEGRRAAAAYIGTPHVRSALVG